MCGFLVKIGKINKKIKKKFVSAFNKLNHRGPDNSKIILRKNLILGHKRLSIIDIEKRSNQPFSDGKSFLLYNGEIYNFKYLKKLLKKKFNHNFKTEGDTEVLFYGLKFEGKNFLKRIDGMFAFCFISENKHALLARDNFGQKPLFYSLKNKDFIAGSELIPILNMFTKDNLSINKFVIRQYLQFGASIAPNTFYNEINQVLPGEVISINLLNYKITKDKINLFKKNTLINQNLKSALSERVNTCLVSDVPIALLSSGGIDSSALIKVMKSVKSKNHLKAFHLSTNEDKEGLKIAKKLVSKKLPLKIVTNKKKFVNKNEIKNILLNRFGEPFADTSYIYSEKLYSSIPKKYKVIIGGDGADEVFFGYKPKTYLYLSSIISKIFSNKINRKLISFFNNFGKFGFYISILFGCKKSIEKVLMGFSSDELNRIFFKKNLFIKHLKNQSTLRGKKILNFYDNYLTKRLTNVFMKKTDHASMKYSKELRSPYLQSDYKELRNMSSFLNNFVAKFKLKLFLFDKLSFNDIFRKKVGFNILSEKLKKKDIKNQILLICNKNKSIISKFFNYENFLILVKNAQNDRQLLRIEILLMWLIIFYEKK